jgi:hypothetical protein
LDPTNGDITHDLRSSIDVRFVSCLDRTNGYNHVYQELKQKMSGSEVEQLKHVEAVCYEE